MNRIEQKITIENKGPNSTSTKEVHLLPCHINYNGPANVSSFFKVNCDVNGSLHGAFRGIEVKGKRVSLNKLPHPYKGHLFKENANNRNMYLLQDTFDEFCHWNRERLPNETDHVPNLLEWINIAYTIHGSPPPQPKKKPGKRLLEVITSSFSPKKRKKTQ